MNQEIHAEFVGKINPHQWEHNSEEVQKMFKVWCCILGVAI